MGCVNSHFDTPSWISGENRTKLLKMTQQSGFRTMRDGIGAAQDLSALGLNTIAQVPLAAQMTYEDYIVPWLESVASKISSGAKVPFVEGANEPDGFWAGTNASYIDRTGVKAYYPEGPYNELKDIWYYVNSNDTLRAALSVIGPAWSENHPIPYTNGEFEPYVDYANYHPYPIGNCWAGVLEYDFMSSYYCTGDDPLNVFGYNYSKNAYGYEWAQPAYGNKQFMMTETGYPTVINATTEEVQVIRYNHKLICFYEIWDSGPSSVDAEENFGIIRYNLTAKPAYLALQSIFNLFADEGEPFQPENQNITVSVAPVGNFTKTEWVHWFLSQKRNGDFLFPIWHEVSLNYVVPKPWTILDPPALPFNLSFHSIQISSCILHNFNPQGIISSQILPVTDSTTVSSVASTTVSILQITPVGASSKDISEAHKLGELADENIHMRVNSH